LAQGKVSGGGTAVNAMAYCRGASSVFDDWATISGNQGLAWDSLLEDFEATTHYTYQSADYEEVVNTTTYGTGPLEISRPSELTGFEPGFMDAIESALGIQQVDLTDGTGIGIDIGLQSIYVSNRTRSYARNTFGLQMASRTNVQVIFNAWVQRVGFSNTTAQNVTYIDTANNETHTIAANEIILSGGAINTPKILMLSGVGPESSLSALNIPVVADVSEIGTNLYDHHYSIIEMEVTSDIKTAWQFTENATEVAIAQAEYAANASGPLGNCDGGTFACARLPDSVFDSVNDSYYTSIPQDRPQILYQYSATSMLSSSPNVSIISAWATLVQPEASGNLTLQSSDYRDDPIINSNYYGSASDKVAIQYAYKQLRSILNSDDLAPYVVREVFPGANVTTDDQIWEAIQEGAQSFHHPIGTVALGTVLDSNWRVKGLSNIRVVDSSALPTPPTCHPQADIYAIAHRAARDIAAADGFSI
jgi:choline dehydrogenase